MIGMMMMTGPCNTVCSIRVEKVASSCRHYYFFTALWGNTAVGLKKSGVVRTSWMKDTLI